MGIKGLWEVVEATAEEVQLLSLAIGDRYRGMPPYRPYTIGINASVWFEQCQQQTWHRAHLQSGQNPALRTFIFRLARLARLPVHLVFCYDGAKRPTVKRNKQVRTNSNHWMVRPTQRVLDAFNIPWLVAPGEAEAQLAHMNKSAIIDAVMTDDSDVFVFGAHTVLLNSSLTDSDTIKVYTTCAIKCQVTPHLHDEAFALMALCCGGDYDEGLQGCGTSTALGLVQCDVLASADSMPPEPGAFNQWRQVLCHHLVHDPTRAIGRLRPSVAASLSDSFPSPNIIQLYLRPAISATVDIPGIDVPHPPDLTALASLVRELLGWEDHIWPAVILKEVLMDLSMVSPSSNELIRGIGCTRAAFLSFIQSQSTRCGVPGRILSVPTEVLVRETLAASQMGSQDCEIPASLQLKLRTWMPSCLIDSWKGAMFMNTFHGQVAGAAHEPAVIGLMGSNHLAPVSLDVIDLTCEED
ncbi:PIN domain-like protein [Boletus edulis]|nr:PIN domain-like protein [Boletus edulis]